jgi:CCR4-NOT transcription complex subunit 1
VQVLIQLGPEITSDPDTVRALLMRFGISDANPPRDVQVVEIISTLARLAAEGTTVCDIGSLVRALCSFVSLRFRTFFHLLLTCLHRSLSLSTSIGPM